MAITVGANRGSWPRWVCPDGQAPKGCPATVHILHRRTRVSVGADRVALEIWVGVRRHGAAGPGSGAAPARKDLKVYLRLVVKPCAPRHGDRKNAGQAAAAIAPRRPAQPG